MLFKVDSFTRGININFDAAFLAIVEVDRVGPLNPDLRPNLDAEVIKMTNNNNVHTPFIFEL